jgi:Domain of unknown function (DUF4126)
MDNPVELLLPVSLGVGLAAAAGFRVFLPLLAMGLAVRTGYLPIAESFQWVGTTPALLMLAVAAMAEIAAYYVPVFDNLLDGLATPTAVGAGMAMSYAVMADLPPMLKWTLAIIAGGGAAAATQGATTLLRGASTATTGGLGNPVLATTEIIAAVVMSALALVLPYVALVVALLFIVIAWRMVLRFRRKRAAAGAA